MRGVILILAAFLTLGIAAFFLSSSQVGMVRPAHAAFDQGSGSTGVGTSCSGSNNSNSIAPKSCLQNPTPNLNTITDLAKQIIQFALTLAGAITVILIIYGGLRYIASRGNANEIEHAKNILEYAILGLLVIIFSYAAITIFVHTVNP